MRNPIPAERLRVLLLLAALSLLNACATTGDPDPWRNTNEKVHRFNERVDTGVFEPVAKGWDFVMPDLVQRMIGNFFTNLEVPRTLVNNVLQGKPVEATQDFGRLVVNTTAGVAGLFDVASAAKIPKNQEDFGQTFGRWGAGPGPYLVIPFSGANCVRDTLAAPLNIVTNPTTWLNGVFGLSVIPLVNDRARLLEEIAQARKDAVDFYVFQRDLYLTGRERDILDGEAPDAVEDDLYDLEELEDEAPLEAEAEEGAETTDAQP
jgi:phospholipid-binding lipoprotein MlaA